MFRRRLPLLTLVATVAVTAAPPGRADTVTAPFLPPATLTPGVPHEVSVALGALRQACTAWHSAPTPPPPMKADATRQPVHPAVTPPERALCDLMLHPEHTAWSMFAASAGAGAVLFFLALVFLGMIRGVLISAWTWRFPFGVKSSW
jgi:hypothetical protein